MSQFSLVSALGQVNKNDYGTDSPLPLYPHELMNYDGGAKTTLPGGGSNWIFAVISDNSIKRVDLNSVTYILYIDRHTANGITVNEVGLFMKNPLGYGTNRSNLVAYRPFVNIAKTDDFALVFKWTLNF